MSSDLILSILLALIAALFACVGQAGGVGYVAVLGLFGFSAATIKTAALALTLTVSAIGLVRYQRSGLLKTRDWAPFAILGVPLSLAGGFLTLPGLAYRFVVAALLIGAAAQMILRAKAATALEEGPEHPIPFGPALVTGGITGLIAGLTGVGAGVFLAAVLMVLKWGSTRRVAAAAQASNLFTSFPALIGVGLAQPVLPPQLPAWVLAVAIGGVIGSWAGAKHLPVTMLRLILALILMASGIKIALG
jgi:uncharacterized membrane protein YfcA